MPRRRRNVRSSKPSLAPRGCRSSTGVSMRAPWGGPRPSGSSSRTDSRSVSERNERIRAGTRRRYGVRRAGPVISSSPRPVSPMRGSRTLRSRASSRTLPHQRPAAPSARARTAIRVRRSSTAADATAAARAAARTTCEDNRATVASARATQRTPTRRCGAYRSRKRPVKVRPALGVARAAPRRCRGWRRGPRPS
jgi:hypothetical protein